MGHELADGFFFSLQKNISSYSQLKEFCSNLNDKKKLELKQKFIFIYSMSEYSTQIEAIKQTRLDSVKLWKIKKQIKLTIKEEEKPYQKQTNDFIIVPKICNKPLVYSIRDLDDPNNKIYISHTLFKEKRKQITIYLPMMNENRP